jgi:hypothetical protein
MRTLKLFLTASMVLGTTAAATMNSAEAGRYRHVAYVPSEAVCPIAPPPFLYIYPAAYWEPFFRRHVYRYGPIYSLCAGVIPTTNLVSVRY